MAAQDVMSSLPTGFGTRPWLVQATRGSTLTLVDPSDQSLHETIIPEIEGKTCLGCVSDSNWLVMLDESTCECFLLSLAAAAPRRRNKMPLPPLHEPLEFIAMCAVLESPGHPDCTVFVSSTAEAGEPFLLHSRPGDPEWTKLSSPTDDGVTFSGEMINYKGKVYSLCSPSTHIIMIDLVDGVVRVRHMGTIEYEEDTTGTGYCVHLVESRGDLFAVWTQELGLFGHDGVLTDITVYRLDISDDDSESMVWRVVASIGDDRAFLLSGGYGFSCNVTGGQMEGNCVYLIWSCCDCERLYKFCLDDMTTSFRQILPQPTHPWCRAFWVVAPANIQAMEVGESALPSQLLIKEVSHPNDPENQVQPTSPPPWHDLPLELLELVVSNLSLVDRLRFPAVCKSWSKISYPVEQEKLWPWLMHCSKKDGICKMFDPLRGKEYTLQVEAFETIGHHIFRSSKDGWVVVSGGSEDDEIFIINPFTGDIVEDPPLFDDHYNYYGISFSSTPVSPDCLFFGITSSNSGVFVTVHTWKHGEDRWSEHEFEYQVSPFPVACNNPVLFHGKFYCLGRKGNLGVFDPGNKDPKSAWKLLDKPEPIHAEMDLFDHDHEGREFCYLVELKGELVSVFMRNAAESPRVFKLDETKVEWIEVEDIGGAALFLDTRASYAMASPEDGHANKIFFPRYSEDGKQAVFYDMETKMYYPSFYGHKQPLKCVWIVPNLYVDKPVHGTLGHR